MLIDETFSHQSNVLDTSSTFHTTENGHDPPIQDRETLSTPPVHTFEGPLACSKNNVNK